MMYIRFPLSLRNVEDILHERGIDICHETIRQWADRFGTYFASKIRKRRSEAMRQVPQWRWHLDEVFVKIRGETHYLWRAVDHEGEVLEAYVTKKRDKASALKFLRKAMKRYGNPQVVVTDQLRSYGAAMKDIGNERRRETGRHLNNRAENSHQPFRRRERDVSLQANAKSSEIRFSPFVCTQPFQSGKAPPHPIKLQNQPGRRASRMARPSCSLAPARARITETGSH